MILSDLESPISILFTGEQRKRRLRLVCELGDFSRVGLQR